MKKSTILTRILCALAFAVAIGAAAPSVGATGSDTILANSPGVGLQKDV
jgi:Skp family chaperone for outer membrane proteins